MNKFNELTEKEIMMLEQAGYFIKQNIDYNEDEYRRCANTFVEYIMSHSKNEIPKIENEFSVILRKII